MTEDKKPSNGKTHTGSAGHRTEVVVDVHPGPRYANESASSRAASGEGAKHRILPSIEKQTLAVPGKDAQLGCSSSSNSSSGSHNKETGGRRQSKSLEIPQQTGSESPRETRRVRSYEEDRRTSRDYDRNKITQFIRRPFLSHHDNYALDGGRGIELQSKVRYNDTGSFEEVDEEKAELLDKKFAVKTGKKYHSVGSAEDAEHRYNMAPGQEDEAVCSRARSAGNYQEIWNLRATFEEEEQLGV